MIAETLSKLAIAVKALETIAEQDYPYAPITDHSALQFFVKTAAEALEAMNYKEPTT